MRWGPFGDCIRPSPFVYFGGITTSGTTLGLGGSMYHIIGEQRGESNPHSASITAHMFAKLSDALNLIPDGFTKDDMRYDISEMRYLSDEDLGDNTTLHCVLIASQYLSGPTQNLEFLAKRLVEGSVEEQYSGGAAHVLLGTPIYVAQVD